MTPRAKSSPAPVALGPSPQPGAVACYRAVSTAGDPIALASTQMSARGWVPLHAVIIEEYPHSNRCTVALWCVRPEEIPE